MLNSAYRAGKIKCELLHFIRTFVQHSSSRLNVSFDFEVVTHPFKSVWVGRGTRAQAISDS